MEGGMEGGREGGREGDPRRRNNFSFHLHVERSAEEVTNWRKKRRITAAMFVLFGPSTRICRAKVINMVQGSS